MHRLPCLHKLLYNRAFGGLQSRSNLVGGILQSSEAGMLGGRLKFTDAQQRAEEFRRQSYRFSWWLWTPLYVLMLAGDPPVL